MGLSTHLLRTNTTVAWWLSVLELHNNTAGPLAQYLDLLIHIIIALTVYRALLQENVLSSFCMNS